ncbi:MAG: UDP-N-acetylmuramoyl-L-alanine--D-glutamate ligase [Pigmentiphaga sp.]|nr:UDP-N-acetylmuramoyl-L-alanine--D-glutamate ligase [Pigmentiphaga sp.]
MNVPESLETSAQSSTLPTLVLGLGESGSACARWCARQGELVRVADSRGEVAIDALREAAPDAEFLLGDAALSTVDGEPVFALSLLDGVRRVAISPGLSLIQGSAAPLVAAARARGIEVCSEFDLFAQALRTQQAQGYTPLVLGVTGTNGKTTVTALTCHLLNQNGLSAVAAGNISPSILTAWMAALDRQDLPQAWVLELSSFQLETTHHLRLDAGVVLNLSQDHLDWHGDWAGYQQAKARLLKLSRLTIVNRADPAVRSLVGALDDEPVRSFGADAPTLAGDLGLDLDHGVSWLCEALADEDEPAPRRKKHEPVLRPAGRLNRLMPADALRIRGAHNALNAQAALLLARVADLGWGGLLRAVRDYEGEPHRLAFVRNVAGVDFIDDSKGTNVGATVAALDGLGQRVVLIAGGVGKGQDFSPLRRSVAAQARAVVLIGQDAPRLQQALGTAVPVALAATLEDAVEQAFGLAQPGDAVLLSPACASMDMFRDYKHRAEVFVSAVQELAFERGEV